MILFAKHLQTPSRFDIKLAIWKIIHMFILRPKSCGMTIITIDLWWSYRIILPRRNFWLIKWSPTKLICWTTKQPSRFLPFNISTNYLADPPTIPTVNVVLRTNYIFYKFINQPALLNFMPVYEKVFWKNLKCIYLVNQRYVTYYIYIIFFFRLIAGAVSRTVPYNIIRNLYLQIYTKVIFIVVYPIIAWTL